MHQFFLSIPTIEVNKIRQTDYDTQNNLELMAVRTIKMTSWATFQKQASITQNIQVFYTFALRACMNQPK